MSDKLDDLLVQLIESHADRVRVLELIAEQRDELRAEVERLRKPIRCPHCRKVLRASRADVYEAMKLGPEIERLRAAARRVIKAYATNDWSEQTKAMMALGEALDGKA